MEQKHMMEQQPASSNDTAAKMAWTTPVLTKLQVEDAESGANISENGATGS